MDRGSFAHDVYMDLVSIQNPQCGGSLPSPHESSETRAVNGMLENLVTSGLGEAPLMRDVGSAILLLVDPARVGREEKTMAEKCSKYVHQSNGTIENAVEKRRNDGDSQ